MDPRLQLVADTVTHGDRRYISHRLIAQDGRAGVAVVATHGDDILLVHQWRHAIGAWQWELPRGFGDGSDASVDATRELREETGLTGTLTSLGTVYADSGLLANPIEVFVAAVENPRAAIADGHEVHRLRWVSEAQLLDEIAAGAVTDGITLAAICLRLVRRGDDSAR